MTLDWDNNIHLRPYGRAVQAAVVRLAEYWAAILERAAKDDAPWTDRTANARQGLHTFVQELANDTVILYLAHGVDYGVYLETKYAGRYAIIWPTIFNHLPQITRMLQSIIR